MKVTLVQSVPRDTRARLPITLFSTGVDANGEPLPLGSIDPHWALTASPDPNYPGPNAYVINPPGAGVPNQPDGQWIACRTDQNVAHAPGDYEFTQTFTLPADIAPESARILGRMACDNGTKFYVNDLLVFERSSGGTHQDTWSTLVPFELSDGFVDGQNTFRAVVTNDPPSGPEHINLSGVIILIDGATTGPDVGLWIPSDFDITVNLVGSQNYFLAASWTPPERPNLIAFYEIEVRAFADALGNTPIDPEWKRWATPPATATEEIGAEPYWLRDPDADVYIRARLRAVSTTGVISRWVYSAFRLVAKQAAPEALASVTLTVNDLDGQHYSLSVSWPAPSSIDDIATYEIAARVFADDQGANPIDPDWSRVLGYPDRTATSDNFWGEPPWPKDPDANVWIRVRLRSLNWQNVPSDWQYSDFELISQAAAGGVRLSQLDPGAANRVIAMKGDASIAVWKTLIAGSNVEITHSDSTITIGATGGGGGSDYPAPQTGWTFDNQDSGALVSGDGIIGINKMEVGSASVFTWLYRDAPAAPFIITARLNVLYSSADSSGDQVGFGLGFRDAAGKYVALIAGLSGGSRYFGTNKFSAANSDAGAYNVQSGIGFVDWRMDWGVTPQFLQIEHNGTNLYFRFGKERRNFFTFDSRAANDYLGTINGIAIMCRGRKTLATVDYWRVD